MTWVGHAQQYLPCRHISQCALSDFQGAISLQRRLLCSSLCVRQLDLGLLELKLFLYALFAALSQHLPYVIRLVMIRKVTKQQCSMNGPYM